MRLESCSSQSSEQEQPFNMKICEKIVSHHWMRRCTKCLSVADTRPIDRHIRFHRPRNICSIVHNNSLVWCRLVLVLSSFYTTLLIMMSLSMFRLTAYVYLLFYIVSASMSTLPPMPEFSLSFNLSGANLIVVRIYETYGDGSVDGWEDTAKKPKITLSYNSTVVDLRVVCVYRYKHRYLKTNSQNIFMSKTILFVLAY